ncbi:hypothetical protein ACSLNR_29340, partial [Escherichia coli]
QNRNANFSTYWQQRKKTTYRHRRANENRRSKNESREKNNDGNMPEWARDNPSHFWQAADQFERANGSTYRELEIALPRELTP